MNSGSMPFIFPRLRKNDVESVFKQPDGLRSFDAEFRRCRVGQLEWINEDYHTKFTKDAESKNCPAPGRKGFLTG